MEEILNVHFDTIITVMITVVGFVITYLMTKKNFKDEIKKGKIALATEQIQTLPYDICQLMDSIIKDGQNNRKRQDDILKEYGSILSKVLAYGSHDAVKIAIKMQRMSYKQVEDNTENKFPMLAAYALLITQLKYDLTSEIISPISWFQLRINDYEDLQKGIENATNSLINELELNRSFIV